MHSLIFISWAYLMKITTQSKQVNRHVTFIGIGMESVKVMERVHAPQHSGCYTSPPSLDIKVNSHKFITVMSLYLERKFLVAMCYFVSKVFIIL